MRKRSRADERKELPGAAAASAPTTGHPGAPLPGEETKRELVRRLLSWFDARRRDLPWRNEADPYRIWVSEVMLQQTRVEAVVPYYHEWLRRFPSIDALADAELGDVLKSWEGLGYYARARNLHRAARLVRERHGGEVPADAGALRALPGVGDYTAGAIASIAFGIPVPAVDGNARRVLARLFDLGDPSPTGLQRLAAELIPTDRPGDFNQALMELGATTCTPRSPGCSACPVERLCRARAAGTQAERPRPRKKKPLPEDDVGTAVVVSPTGRLLLTRRPEHGLLGGLWEFPGAPAARGEEPVAAATRAARAVVGEHVGPGAFLGSIVHTFSHRRTTYHAVRFAAQTEPAVAGRIVWAAPDELGRFALPAAQQRIAALALGSGHDAAGSAAE